MPEQSSSLAKLLAFALIVAVICNGASFYLKRTGLVDHDAYRNFWAVHCADSPKGFGPRPEPQCFAHTTPEESGRAWPPVWYFDATYRYVYEMSAAERPLKLAKDLFWLALIAVSMWTVAKNRPRFADLKPAGPLLLLSAHAVAAFGASVWINGPLIAAAGLRSFVFVFAALLGRWLVGHMATFARGVGVLLIVQAFLVPFELVRGIHMFHEWSIGGYALASRIAGTLAQPNSMGVFAAAALAFLYSFSPARTRLWPFGLVAVALVLLSGSATGWVCAALALLAISQQRVPDKYRSPALVAGILGVALAILMLPMLTGRQNVFESIGFDSSRWSVLRSALLERGPLEVLLGSGMGVNTNAALNLATMQSANAGASASMAAALPTDSTLSGLLIQVGVAGTLLFYGVLLWAGLRDRVARPFYFIVSLCTLTINVTELFPVNVLLGLALAHSAWGPARRL